MSIRGVGLDLVTISAFAAQLEIPGTRFEANTFTESELADVAARAAVSHDRVRHLAARWAAKEAVFKAFSIARHGLPTTADGVDEDAIAPTDLEVVTDAAGRPRIVLHGALATALAGTTIHISLSHDGDTAAAVAIIETEGVATRQAAEG